MPRLILMFFFLTFGALSIFIGLEELVPQHVPEKNKFEARLEKDFIAKPDPFFISALKNAKVFDIQRLGTSPEMRMAENFFADLPKNPNGTQRLELSIFDGEEPNLIVLQFSLFDNSENKIGEWAKSYIIANDKKKSR